MKKTLVVLMMSLVSAPAFALQAGVPLVCRNADSSLEVNYYRAKAEGPITMRLFLNGSEKPAVTAQAQMLVARCMPRPGSHGCPTAFTVKKRSENWFLQTNLGNIQHFGRANGTFTYSKGDYKDVASVQCELVRRVGRN